MENSDQLRLRLEASVRGAVRFDANLLTIGQLVELFLIHGTADFAMRRGTQESGNFKDATRELLLLYSDLPCREFDVLHLKVIRKLMIENGLTRQTINQHRIRRIKAIIRWATDQHGLDGSVWARISAVNPLRPGIDGVTESPMPPAASFAQVQGVLRDRKCPMKVRAMLMLQASTGARPGEVCGCQGIDIDQSRDPWLWRPKHKMLWRNRQRIIPIGQSGQLACMPFLNDGYLFTTKLWRGQGGKPYRVDHYHQSITASCIRTRTPRFSPQSVRRFTLTQADELGGIETACELASHSDVRTTERYLRRAGRRAIKFAQELG